MTEQKVILLRKRGFNYYSDYAETYLERAFSPYGYHLTLRPEQQEWKCSLQYAGSKQLVFRAPWLSDLPQEKLEALCALLAASFKTKAQIAPEDAAGPDETPPETIEYGFTSACVGAFYEPPFITEGLPVLRSSHVPYAFWSPREPFYASYQNYGGPAKGLHVRIALPEGVSVKRMELSTEWDPQVKNYREAERRSWETAPQILREDGKAVFLYDFTDFAVPEGINKFSRKQIARKADNEASYRSFSLLVFFDEKPPEGTMELSVWAFDGNTPDTIIV